MVKNPGPQGLEQIPLILDANPEILELAFADLTRGRTTDTGRDGMTAEHVLPCAILKQLRELTYDDLEYYLADSLFFRNDEQLENGRKIRLDSTVVESDIHLPSNSTLLWDGVRVTTCWFFEGKNFSPRPLYAFSDHRRVVKKQMCWKHSAKSFSFLFNHIIFLFYSRLGLFHITY